jgi:hypothetical protein
MRIDIGAIRTDLRISQDKADSAHKRIDAYDNRIWGMSFIGGAVVSAVFLAAAAGWWIHN